LTVKTCRARGEIRTAYKILVRKPEEKRSFREQRQREEESNKDLRKTGCKDVGSIQI
jgi:hypothetical protein